MATKEHKYELGSRVYIDMLEEHGRVCVVYFGENERFPTYEVCVAHRFDGFKSTRMPEYFLSDPKPDDK